MIDIENFLEKIGQRIREQRKCVLRISQEQMADDLDMYQADISNLENAKSGSGICDLTKLNLIADYLHLPLESLLFGRENNNIPQYDRNQDLKLSKKKMTKEHRIVLKKLTEQAALDKVPTNTYECGPYVIYTLLEQQFSIGSGTTIEGGKIKDPEFVLPKFHTYIFLGEALIGVMVSSYTTAMQHVFQTDLKKLIAMMQPDIQCVTDVWRTLNPYWALWLYSDDGPEQDRSFEKMVKRMDEIRAAGEKRPILYIESVYVCKEYRQRGIFRMYIDLLKAMCPGCVMWLILEPTSGAELHDSYNGFPMYTISELGQLNMNAAIAEKVGFRIDPSTCVRQTKTTDADGNITIEDHPVREYAYYLPAKIRELLADDGDLVLLGRQLQERRSATESWDEPQS